MYLVTNTWKLQAIFTCAYICFSEKSYNQKTKLALKDPPPHLCCKLFFFETKKNNENTKTYLAYSLITPEYLKALRLEYYVLGTTGLKLNPSESKFLFKP